MEIPTAACSSTILNERKGIKESSKRADQQGYCYTRLAEPVMVSSPLENDYQKSNSLTHPKVLLSLEEKTHPLIKNLSLRLVEWLVSGKFYFQKGCQKRHSTYPQMPKE